MMEYASTVFRAGIQNFNWIVEFSTFRLEHERLARVCVEREADVHNRFEMAATTRDSWRPMVQLRFHHDKCDSPGRAAHRSRFLLNSIINYPKIQHCQKINKSVKLFKAVGFTFQ